MLLLIFSVGGIAVIASIVRINALYIYQHSNGDQPYTGAWILIWSQVELNAAVISSSAPALKPLAKGILGGSGIFSASKYGRSGGAFTGQSKNIALRSFNGEKSVSGGTGIHTTEIRGKTIVNESEENIIGKDLENHGGIYRTTDVTVDVEHGNGGRSTNRY